MAHFFKKTWLYWQWFWLNWWSGHFWHQMSIVQIQASNFLFTVLNLCCKDKNKEKEAGNGTFFKKKTWIYGQWFWICWWSSHFWHQMSVVRIQAMNFLFTVLNLCFKDKNKEKAAGNGTFFKKTWLYGQWFWICWWSSHFWHWRSVVRIQASKNFIYRIKSVLKRQK